jgi:protein-S-isoprenylcysteine O-methyltransferase Ste14
MRIRPNLNRLTRRPMQIQMALSEPLFELKGRANRIDLSAWVSGISFGCGLLLANTSNATDDLLIANGAPLLMLASFAAFIASVLVIQRHMRLSLMANTFGSPRRLVQSGVFRYSRNPIYVAFFLPLASITAVSLSAAIAATGLYILVMNLTVIRKEERDLLNAFGREYADYLASTPRWIV